MEASLLKLRSLFAFVRNSDDNVEPQHLNDLLEGLQGQPEKFALNILLTQYIPGVNHIGNLQVRFNLLEKARETMKRMLPSLEEMVAEAVLPLPTVVAESALMADNFLKNLAGAYAGIVSNVSSQHLDSTLPHLLQQSIRRAMQTILRRQMLAYRAYAKPSASSWQQLHDLYRNARDQHLETGQEEQTIERIYLSALLLEYCEPGKFPRSQLDLLRDLIWTLSDMAAVVDAGQFERDQASLASRFLVATDDNSAGKALSRTAENVPMFGNLIIECRAIVSALDRRLSSSQPPTTEHEAPETMLLAVRTALGGQSSRRFNRMRFKPRADLVAGFDHAVAFISGGHLNRRRNDPAETEAISEWALIDESPDSFGIRYQRGKKWPVQAGDLVVLRTREETRLHVCLVRRISNLDQQVLELGVQELSPQASVTTLPDTDGRPMRAIVLPTLPSFDGHVGLLVASGTLPPDAEIVTESHPVANRWRPGKHAESNGRIEFHVLEPVI